MIVEPEKNKRMTIGLMIMWLRDSYHFLIWKSIAARAESCNVNLRLYAGGSSGFGAQLQNRSLAIYDLADLSSLDGLIIVTSSLTNYLSNGELSDFCGKYKSVPVITIGNKVGDLPAILTDNASGAYQQVKHLIEEHGFRRFAYLSGPPGNADALLRLQVFRQALREYNIPLNPDLVLEGDFCYHYKKSLLDKLLDKQAPDFDVLVCANDAMAINSIEYFQARGYNVPGQIAVVGFDDIPAARYANPPLTTVSQPFREVGEKAFELLADKWQGKTVADSISLSTQLHIRQSCGCLSDTIARFDFPPQPVEIAPLKSSGSPQRADLLNDICGQVKVSAGKESILRSWLEEFTGLAESYLKDERTVNQVLYSFTGIVSGKLEDPENELFWHQLLHTIRQSLLRHAAACFDPRQIILLFRILSFQLSELLLHTSANKTRQYWNEVEDLNLFKFNLMSTFDFSELVSHIIRELPELHINSCYVFEFEAPVTEEDSLCCVLPQWSKPVLLYRDHKMISLTEQERRWPTRKLLSFRLLPEERNTMIHLPLIFTNRIFGCIIFQLSDCNPSIFTMLQAVISNGLQGARFITEIKQARDLAESAGRMKTEFLANISHEIRTPLNSILGYTELLREEASDSRSIGKLKIIYDAGYQLLNIINDLLDFSKIEADSVEFSEDVFSVRQLLSIIGSLFDRKAADKKLNFEIRASGNLLEFIHGDQQRISQVIVNLVDNALKFTEKGGVTCLFAYNKSLLTIEVRDTGIGIPAEYLEQIFFPFSQVDSTNTRCYGGSGLGLAISRGLVKLMNGEISVVSKPGSGSTFTVKLPLKAVPTTEQQADLSAPLNTRSTGLAPAQPRQAGTEAFRILVAEDEESNRKLYTALLNRIQVEHDFAENGLVALTMLNERNYDLLLLDMLMPVMDGTETLRKIRGSHHLKNLYVIAVTAHAMKSDEQKYLDAGCDDYLAKPIEKDIFNQKILSRRQLKQAAGGSRPVGVNRAAKPPGQQPSLQSQPLSLSFKSEQQLEAIRGKLRQCMRIFDGELIKQAADELGRLSPCNGFADMKKQLYHAADNYELIVIREICEALGRIPISDKG